MAFTHLDPTTWCALCRVTGVRVPEKKRVFFRLQVQALVFPQGNAHESTCQEDAAAGARYPAEYPSGIHELGVAAGCSTPYLEEE
jgi:hypothetical protein